MLLCKFILVAAVVMASISSSFSQGTDEDAQGVTVKTLSPGIARISWDAMEQGSSLYTLTYSIFRDTREDFTPSAKNRISRGLKITHYDVREPDPSQDYYYLVQGIRVMNPPVFGLRLGMSRQEVCAKLGGPTRYFDAGTQRYLRSREWALMGPVFEIYKRKTEAGEFELRINYGEDESGSRLHPTPRIDWVIVEFDHTQSVRQVLRSSPEVAALCLKTCRVLKDTSGNETSLRLSDPDENEVLSMEYFDKNGTRDIKDLDDSVSRVSFEKFFELDHRSVVGIWPSAAFTTEGSAKRAEGRD